MASALRVAWARACGARRRTACRRASRRRVEIVERVVVVSVAARASIALSPRSEVRRRFGISPEFFRSERRAGGVTTMYSEPWRLGADRLVGAIGAFHLSKHRPVCVVSIGTTLTLDFVDAERPPPRGRHRARPGVDGRQPAVGNPRHSPPCPGWARQAGASSRAARARPSPRARGTPWPSIADRAVLEARAVAGRTPLLLLTGGAAPDIARLIRTRHRYVPDLVLQGLAVIASTRPIRA